MNSNRQGPIKGFDLSHPDNYDLNVIISLSGYFHTVSLEYFSRILHSYATELLQLPLAESERHYYYRSCMNIYAACLYQMFSTRARSELLEYISQKKKYLNASAKFDLYVRNSNIKTQKKKTSVKNTSSVVLSRSKQRNHTNGSGAVAKPLLENKENPIIAKLKLNIGKSEPVFHNYKLLRYQSHVLGNISEGSILEYLFINYIGTPKFTANVNFVAHCFVSSLDKAELIINKKIKARIIKPVPLASQLVKLPKISAINRKNKNLYAGFKTDTEDFEESKSQSITQTASESASSNHVDGTPLHTATPSKTLEGPRIQSFVFVAPSTQTKATENSENSSVDKTGLIN